MRVGVLCRGEIKELDWAHRLGFESVAWIRFDSSMAMEKNGQGYVENIAAHAQSLNLRISAIGALYRNPLHPPQSEYTRSVFRRAVQVAAQIGVTTVCGFPGAIIETEIDKRGGNPVYKSMERYLPELIKFWEPIAHDAAEVGVRIAFEHCPQGQYHLPIMGYNMMAQPAMWERFFNDCKCENIGLEWDPAHLICQFIDPVQNIHTFGSRIFHVHAKDAYINKPLLEKYGICHPGVAEHRFPGLGQSDWGQIIHALVRAGYDSDLSVEGMHDPVFRDHTEPAAPQGSAPASRPKPQPHLDLEQAGLRIALRTLRHYTQNIE